MVLKLKRKLPANRSYNQILNHYLVEKSIADRLKTASREERKHIYKVMYDELFEKVPDHPRLTRRDSKPLTQKANRNKLALISRFIDKSTVFAEFAPGDCEFAFEVSKHVKFIYGIDISDQRNSVNHIPDNFKLIIYDGYNLDEVESNSVDVLFSDQLIEHFHPEDTRLHFEMVHRILKSGGKYIFRTPHRLSGPHDTSGFFCDEAECFHLKEWTYVEIKTLLKDLKYSHFQNRWHKKGIDVRLPYLYFALCEKLLGIFPKRTIRRVIRYLIPSLYVVAVK